MIKNHLLLYIIIDRRIISFNIGKVIVLVNIIRSIVIIVRRIVKYLIINFIGTIIDKRIAIIYTFFILFINITINSIIFLIIFFLRIFIFIQTSFKSLISLRSKFILKSESSLDFKKSSLCF